MVAAVARIMLMLAAMAQQVALAHIALQVLAMEQTDKTNTLVVLVELDRAEP